MRKRCVSRSPYWIVSADNAAGGVDGIRSAYVVPKLNGRVQRAGHDLAGVIAVPINAVDLGAMSGDSREGSRSMASVPDVEVLVVGARDDLVILAIPLDLGCSRCVIGKLQRHLPAAKVMYEDEAVHATCRE